MKNSIHIGEKIREKARELRIGPTELSRSINTSIQNIYGIFKRKSIDTELLERISEAMNFDFFSYYSATPEVPLNGNNFNEKKAKRSTGEIIKELQNWMKELEKALQDYNSREIAYLKKINELLEKKTEEENKSF